MNSLTPLFHDLWKHLSNQVSCFYDSDGFAEFQQLYRSLRGAQTRL